MTLCLRTFVVLGVIVIEVNSAAMDPWPSIAATTARVLVVMWYVDVLRLRCCSPQFRCHDYCRCSRNVLQGRGGI